MQEVFPSKKQGQCNLKNQMGFVIVHIKSVSCGIETLRVLEPKMWEYLPPDVNNKESVDSFKTAFNPFVPIGPFFWCFHGVEKGCIGNE